jgi:hypothetical protein
VFTYKAAIPFVNFANGERYTDLRWRVAIPKVKANRNSQPGCLDAKIYANNSAFAV